MNRTIDITSAQRETLLALLKQHLPQTTAWVYGSRVQWTARPQSDLDMVVFASPSQNSRVSALREAFDESNLPFRVDLFVWDDIPDQFRKQIEAEYVVIVQNEELGDMREWRETTLGAVVDLRLSSVDKKSKAGEQSVQLCNYTDVYRNSFISSNLNFMLATATKQEISKCSLISGDVVITKDSEKHDDIGVPALVKEDIPNLVCGYHLAILRPSLHEIDGTYLFYSLNSINTQQQFHSLANGVTRFGLRKTDIANVRIPFPPLHEQRAIAHILGTLDDKIELNRRMNETLEAMAQALFKSWFVDFDPVHAKATLKRHDLHIQRFGNNEIFENCFGVLESIHNALHHHPPRERGSKDASLSQRSSPPPPQPSPDDSLSVTPPPGGSEWTPERARTYLDSMDDDIMALFPDSFEDSELGKIPKGWEVKILGECFNLTMGQSPPGSTYNDHGQGLPFFQGRTDFGFRFPENRKFCTAPTRLAQIGDTIVSVRAPVGDINMAWEQCCIGRGVASLRHKSASSSFTYYSAWAIQEKISVYEHTGTVFGAINKKQFEELPVTETGSKLIEVFDACVHPIDVRIRRNISESRILTALRDTLLPKLLSGEVRVGKVKQLSERSKMMVLVTENQLDNWVRGNAQEAQTLIVELVYRLVAASCPKTRERRFPLGDSIGQHGPDGILHVDLGFKSFVPEGSSFWEIGSSLNARNKATEDYKHLTNAVPKRIRMESTFVFVTPLSGRRDWEYTWKEGAQADWLKTHRDRNDWKDVRIIDGTILIDWVHQFPAVELWLVSRIHGPDIQQIKIPENHWELLKSIGNPFPLPPTLFLVNREEACQKLLELFDGKSTQLNLITHFPDHAIDFVCAYIASLDEEHRIDVTGRTLIISDPDAWSAVCNQWRNFILIADTALDLSGDSGNRAIQQARNAGHSIVVGGAYAGPANSSSVSLFTPRQHKLKQELNDVGYPEQRAQTLVERCDGDLSSLLRLLQGFPLLPDWARNADSTELATAALLGSWMDGSAADRAVVKSLTGKEYEEWVEKIRKITLTPGTPIICREGSWKFISRYEGWYALGNIFSDQHLDKLKNIVISVLTEADPRFKLHTNEQWLANIHGTSLTHSPLLRKGLAETLALLGSHPKALTSCAMGKSEYTATFVVKKILFDADWILWGSLDNLLPLLAEAAPGEFLKIVENALQQTPCPFDELFAQENVGVFGGNYTTGLLWALETLAWDEEFFVQACVTLAELAARAPGGNKADGPVDSLTRILLPWLPRTTASLEKRKAALKTLQEQVPKVAWKVLLTLLPNQTESSSSTHKPVWRDTIPDDWKEGVSDKEYWEQVVFCAEQAVEMASIDIEKLECLVDHLDDLPEPAFSQALEHLSSEAITNRPEEQRMGFWTKLVKITHTHREFPDAKWALPEEKISRIESITAKLAPQKPWNRHRLIFGNYNPFYEETGDWEEQRQTAVKEIISYGEIDAVIQFADTVEQPWCVGNSLGAIAKSEYDEHILPAFLETDNRKLVEFVRAFIWSRQYKNGWKWADGLDRSHWSASQVGQFLSWLPFTKEAWNRATNWLGENEREYWDKVRPYDSDDDISFAIDKLVEHGQPRATITSLYRMLQKGQLLDKRRVVTSLLAAASSTEPFDSMNTYNIIELIKSLQNDPETDPEELFRIESAYLSLLNRKPRFFPKTLENKLASDPVFFCEVIRRVYRSTKETRARKKLSEQDNAMISNARRLLNIWKTTPGTQNDGTFLPDDFQQWLAQVKQSCHDSGHLEVALSQIGQGLIHSPPDPGGLWIHHSVACALNDKSAEIMREGYNTGIFNSRGAHFVDPAGKPELKLAEQFKQKAEQIENAGFQRLAATLRKISEQYSLEAQQIIAAYKNEP